MAEKLGGWGWKAGGFKAGRPEDLKAGGLEEEGCKAGGAGKLEGWVGCRAGRLEGLEASSLPASSLSAIQPPALQPSLPASCPPAFQRSAFQPSAALQHSSLPTRFENRKARGLEGWRKAGGLKAGRLKVWRIQGWNAGGLKN